MLSEKLADGKECCGKTTRSVTERYYEYDDNWQLTKCREVTDNKTTTEYLYEYDEAGNRTAYAKTVKGIVKERFEYKYNDANQLVTKIGSLVLE